MNVRIGLTCVGGRLMFDTITALRNVEELNLWILGIDGSKEAHGRILCDAFHTMPSADRDPDAFGEALLDLAKAMKLDLLILNADEEVQAALPKYKAFEALGTRLSIGPQAPIDIVLDKFQLYEKLRLAGVQTLQYRPADSLEELTAAACALGYPDNKIVVKPRTGRGSRGVILLDAAAGAFENIVPGRFCGRCKLEALDDAFASQGEVPRDYLVMEYLEGDTYDVDVLADDGKALRVITRLRQLRNPFWPTSTGHKIITEPDAVRVVEAATTALAMDGAADFDVVMSRSGPIILDAACRFSGSVAASSAAGANTPGDLVRARLGLSLIVRNLREGVPVRPFITMAEIPAANERDYL